ncbi:SDR family oxidoreductase [Mesorhizobium sp. M1B.F.Ca.ET.045.04.1.1]|uniref:SDR family NAD(P)-dependent oxidoreductase n=1 Tax=Mesorhizobium sp. M1B.F.Ca.ET.045.04.1.1 TaxID=2493673 RepID=UPI000F750B72|nr:SDR family oxidoreductase [Mesorhizobium sp. M1B.F.Ca.ET.045.04.1.1]AZO29411.1 SDR family oxidoreductase [Mesorhizobium sp. M1B.F.Ca.ET.045.04.1.1]
MTIVITGWRSAIAEEFRRLLRSNEEIVHGKPMEPNFPLGAERYLFCQGLLRPKRIEDQTDAEIREGIEVNFASIVRACDLIFATNVLARVCVIGSESGYRGSFDENYASAKELLHAYVEKKRLSQLQQLVAISPGIIGDCRMTTSRTDVENLIRRREEHPKRRFLEASEVAAMARTLLYFQPYISGTIIRMHGGLH